MKRKLRLLRENISIVIAGVALIISIASLIVATKNVRVKTVILSAISPDPMVLMVNEERTKRELLPLVESVVLNRSATDKACDMRDNNYFAHESPSGRSPWFFFATAGYDYIDAGENLVDGLDNEDAMKALMKSEKHRDNILDPDYEEMSIGRCGAYTAQHFGKPQAK